MKTKSTGSNSYYNPLVDKKVREIKFRAWYKIWKMLYLNGFVKYGEGWGNGNHEYKFYGLHFGEHGYAGVKASETPIMQFTGLYDKNNNPIYEGDIVTWHGGGQVNENKVGDVYYKDARFFVRNYYIGFLDEPNDAFGEGLQTIHVIGNIYENPEYLNQKQ